MSYTVPPQQDIRVYVAGGPNADVTGDPSERSVALVLIEIVRAMGGDRLDHATFSYDLAQAGIRLRNLKTPLNFSRKVEVRLYTGEEASPGVDEFVPLFFGDLTTQDLAVVVNVGESVGVTASIFPYMFGNTLPGVRYYDPYGYEGQRYVDVWEEVEFNPLVDGQVEEGMALATLDPGGGAGEYHLWADPESYRTTGAAAIQNLNGEGGRARWTLAEAVYSVCWLCNPDEIWIKNPDRATLISVAASAIPIDNLKLPPGKHLPFYLDNLLTPYGFSWVVELVQDPDPANAGLSLRRIKVVSRSSGPEKTLMMQDVGETLELDPAEYSYTNCKSFRVRTDIGNVANEVRAVGARKERELTLPLFRTWDGEDDDLTGTDLAQDEPDSQYNTANKVNVWRKWVACEAGDFTDFYDADGVLRATPEVTDGYIAAGYWLVPRRRRAESRLVRDEDGKRRRPTLEFSDDAGYTWALAPWQHYILSTQIGVLFDENEPPAELIAAGDEARLRITCTVLDDERVDSTAPWSADSPNAAVSAVTVDASDRFFYRDIDSGVTVPTGADTDERDDTALLETFAEHIRDAEKSADIRAEAEMFVVETDYAVGDTLTEIEGRNIDLNLNDPDGLETRYLQITELVVRPIGVGWNSVIRAMPQQVPPYYFRKPEADDRERRRD